MANFVKMASFCKKYRIKTQDFQNRLIELGLMVPRDFVYPDTSDLPMSDILKLELHAPLTPSAKARNKLIGKRSKGSKGDSNPSNFDWNEDYLLKVLKDKAS